jgi:hypothetical protein
MSLAYKNPGLWSQLIARSLIAQPTYLAYPTFICEIHLLLSTKSEPNVKTTKTL